MNFNVSDDGILECVAAQYCAILQRGSFSLPPSIHSSSSPTFSSQFISSFSFSFSYSFTYLFYNKFIQTSAFLFFQRQNRQSFPSACAQTRFHSSLPFSHQRIVPFRLTPLLESLVLNYKTICHIWQDRDLSNHCRENLKLFFKVFLNFHTFYHKETRRHPVHISNRI
jgi:hypothetical protein